MNPGPPPLDVFGPYRGAVARAFDTPEFRAALASLPDLLAAGVCIQDGRHRLYRCGLRFDAMDLDLAIKAFGPPSAMERAASGFRSSKAHRTWQTALRLWAHGERTPEPVAFLERPDAGAERYYLARYKEGCVSFREALNDVYRTRPESGVLMALLQQVADAIREMHDAGLAHRDLGNQNILLMPTGGGGWNGVQFIDLNRARRRTSVSLRERARDLSRIALPSDFRRVFFQMYFGSPAPTAFLRWERRFRARFDRHTRTRRWRHPIREWKPPRGGPYPAPRDIWIWDERSGQAISAWTSRDRRRLYPHAAYTGVGARMIQHLPAVARAYRQCLRSAFQGPVSLAGRIGVAVQVRPDTEARETAFLQALGPIPVQVRFYHHESEPAWAYTAEAVRRLHARGHRVTVSFVQDRRAVRDPERWRTFLLGVLSRIHDVTEAVEVGHAINRVKWGIWSPAEYRRLMEPAAEAMTRYPDLDWLGPAGIDAEFPRIQAFLHALPAGMRFSALSQHLYVDRRGAPENRQGRMATLEKAAAARALAVASGTCADRLIITEVNWPLVGTGVYSPVCSPYMYPGQTVGAPNVTVREAADYLLRYLLITLCSGLAERVFWWRLAAHGYGLVDDRAPGGWHARPAFDALSFFLRSVGTGRFLRRLPAPPGANVWLFETGDTRQVWAYAHPGSISYHPPFSFVRVTDALGRARERKENAISLSGTPVLFSDVRV